MKQVISWLTNFQKKCSVCDGTGEILCNCNENSELACPNCHGTGAVSVRKSTSQKYEVPCDYPGCKKGMVSCGVCNGSGKHADGSVCQACHGSGRTKCSVCNGVGKIKRVKQETWLEHEVCHVCGGRGMVECYQCHGTKARVCPECKGKGTVVNIGKVVLLVFLAALVIAMPVLVAAVALIALGCSLFVLEQKNKEQRDVDTAAQTEESRSCQEDKKIEFSEVE